MIFSPFCLKLAMLVLFEGSSSLIAEEINNVFNFEINELKRWN